tara:strand:- start:3824 stop:4447 length:624 start_codon:yes stop_codon:yes gene_type:complete
MEPIFINNLKKRLKQHLPGDIAQNEMRVRTKFPLKNYLPDNEVKPAAVLVLLYPNKDNWYFFLTKRTQNVDHHKGQISLPGGMVEKDELQKNAAIRETYEEIGVLEKKIKIIGKLTKFLVPVSGFEIFPFVGWIDSKPKTNIQPTEVEKVFSVSVKLLIHKKTKKSKKSILNGIPATIPYFDLGNEMVWGATSNILSEFRSVLKDII